MSIDAIESRRIRRAWEPTEKQWNDDVLEIPWENVVPPLHQATVFSLKNVFFFSHATAIQVAALKSLREEGQSAIIEAPTGSGKTLAFLLPVMERTIRWCDWYTSTHQKPPLTRNILGVILSPSRALAEQTYVVGKRLAARYPYNIQFVLCDNVVESCADLLKRLQRTQRGGGIYLVTTPKDFTDFLQHMQTSEGFNNLFTSDQVTEDLIAQQDEETRRRHYARQAQGQVCAEVASDSSSRLRAERLGFFSAPHKRFIVVMDEADLLFKSPDMHQTVVQFIQDRCLPIKGGDQARASATRSRKRQRHGLHEVLYSDFAFVGATVATSPRLKEYAEEVCKACGTNLDSVSVGSPSDFLAQLQSKYAICEASDFLPNFIQLINLHSSKKHFVFFNSHHTLKFIERLFRNVCRGVRPLLFINSIYTMYEGMAENARIEQYNAFLTHSSHKEASSKPKKPFSDTEKKNQVFAGGCKREGRTAMGSGAILLCTDIAAFGLDVRDVDYAYHFEPPSSVEAYVHRIGRVGRMGMRGSSMLLLPCMVERSSMGTSTEHKADRHRFETIANTKESTRELHPARVLLEHLGTKWEHYLKDLEKHVSLQKYVVPPFAPISSTLRNVIHSDGKMEKLARRAAMSMCEVAGSEKASWFTPIMCLRAFFLD